LLSYDAVYSQILILLVVLNRRFRGRAKLAILYQDWKTSSLVEHELKMFNHGWAALRAWANLQHWEAKGNLNVSHVTVPYSRVATGVAAFYVNSRVTLLNDWFSAHWSFVLQW
jgi:hypothetical protein